MEEKLLKLEIKILKQKIKDLQGEKIHFKTEILREVAKKLVSKNFAFPIIIEITGLKKNELLDIFSSH